MEDEKKESNNAPPRNNQSSDNDAVDGNAFLSHLRAAGAFADAAAAQESIGHSNKRNRRQDFASLEDLFARDDQDDVVLSPKPDIVVPLQAKPSPLSSPTTNRPKHSRGVSWGRNSTEYFDDDLSSLGTGNNNNNSRRHLTLDDVVRAGPFVEEAESNIIRCLEQQRSQRDLSYAKDNLLSQVPETAVHDFSTNDDEEERNNETAPDDDEDPDTMNPQETITTTTNTKESEERPLIHRQHRRVMTVEDTLAGLTEAMSALHDRHHRTHHNNHQRRNSQVSLLSSDSEHSARHHHYHHEDHHHHASTPPQPEYSDSGAFAANAARLAEDRKQKARGMWDLLLKNLPTLKEEAERTQSEESFHHRVDSTSMESDGHHRDVESGRGGEDAQSGDSSDEDKEGHGVPGVGSTKHKRRRHRGRRRSTMIKGATDNFKEDWRSFFRPRKDTVWTYIKCVLFYIIAPLLGVACCLFYVGDNPIRGISQDGSTGDSPSVSWSLLFAVRHIVTFSMALAIQGLIIDFFALGTKIMLRLVGPVVTLLIVQAKGWPFICFWWGILDFAMLYGKNSFARHWLFWQDAIGLFNDSNPSGHVVDSDVNRKILTIVVTVSAVVAVKRFVVGLYLGRQTFNHYGNALAVVMNKMLLVSEVAGLAKSIEKAKADEEKSDMTVSSESQNQLKSIAQTALCEDEDDNYTNANTDERSELFNIDNRDPLTGSLRDIEKVKLMNLLGRWEDPDTRYHHANRDIATISAVLRFRKALTLIHRNFPFSISFGPADTREACIDSAQRVYDRLLMKTPGEKTVHFETLALLALDSGHRINQQKAKDMVKVFRPDRDGNLTMLDFVKSIDSVYKEYRLLIASIDNSSQIDRAFENILNVLFYVVVVTIVLSQLGFNPLAMFLSLSSVILAFAFMIGSASAKYFEGLLFILVRRPYNIGDRIHVSGVETDTSFDGAPGWTVEHVTLFETVARWAPTNERASLSNGSLASSRIINWARSTQAQFHLFLKLPINTPYEKIVVLKNAIEEYMKARPREWLAFNGFRANKIETEKAYIEYVIVVQHRDAWQNIGQVLDSKANMSSYILEVTKQLNMNYKAPSLPVDLKYSMQVPSLSTEPSKEEEFDAEARMQDFRNITHKHNIRLG